MRTPKVNGNFCLNSPCKPETMECYLLKCGDDSSFKPSRSELEGLSSWFHSDTLWSALVNIYAGVWPNEVPAFIQAFEDDQIRLSSALPALEKPDGTLIHLLPKPKNFDAGELDQRKAWKKVHWICPQTLEKGSSQGLDPAKSFSKDIYIAAEGLGFAPEKLSRKPDFFRERDLPKVKVHSQKSTDSFYYLPVLNLRHQRVNGRTWEPHFYFLIDCKPNLQSHLKKKLRICIHLIAETGLGGEKSSGIGQFKSVETTSVDWLPREGTHSLSLSVVHPSDPEELACFESYGLRVRGGGRLGDPEDQDFHRQRIRMISEGSVFTGNPKGSIRDISPVKRALPWPIYRYGKVFSIPFTPGKQTI